MSKKINTKGFIDRSLLVHKNFYDYSLVHYINNRTEVEIICPVHGSFFQRPDNHLTGNGCFQCGLEKSTKSQNRSDKYDFIKKSQKIHLDPKYDYSEVVYVNAHIKVKIICPIHGSFFQKPNNHLSGKGCEKCAWEKRGMSRRDSVDDFISKSRKIHGNKYDYSKSDYNGNSRKTEIICSKHGPFFIKPGNHIYLKEGCPKCANRISKNETLFLDILKIRNRQVWINKYQVDGIKNNNIYEFLGDYWHGNPQKFDPNKINEITKKTFKNLYDQTISKFLTLNKLGYDIYYIWENDWKIYIKNKNKSIPIKKFNGDKLLI